MTTPATKPRYGRPVTDRIRDLTVVDENGCWIWTGAIDSHGYGRIKVDGRTQRAHRAAYEAFVGPFPEGALALHACDVRACVNPDHLRPGSASENEQDKLKRGRHPNAAKTHCINGHAFEGHNVITFGGHRKCRACHNARINARRAAERVSA